jgi:hypothetical protein
VTFLPLRPLFSFPLCISCISVSTCFPALGLYFRPEDFFVDEDFLEEDFLVDVFLPDDFLRLAFFVAIGWTLP